MNNQQRSDLGAFIPSFLDDYPLDPYEFRLYARISRRAGSGKCFESLYQMAEKCGMSIKKARVAFTFLCETKLIQIEERKGKSSFCWTTPVSEWLSPDEAQKLKETAPEKYTANKKSRSSSRSSSSGINATGGTCASTTSGTYSPTLVEQVTYEGITSKGTPDKVLPLNATPEPVAPPTQESERENSELPKQAGQVEHPVEVVPQATQLPPSTQPASNNSLPVNQAQESASKREEQNLKPDQSSARSAILSVEEIHEILGDKDRGKVIEFLRYNTRKLPWMANAYTIKSELVEALWESNKKLYTTDRGELNDSFARQTIENYHRDGKIGLLISLWTKAIAKQEAKEVQQRNSAEEPVDNLWELKKKAEQRAARAEQQRRA